MHQYISTGAESAKLNRTANSSTVEFRVALRRLENRSIDLNGPNAEVRGRCVLIQHRCTRSHSGIEQRNTSAGHAG